MSTEKETVTLYGVETDHNGSNPRVVSVNAIEYPKTYKLSGNCAAFDYLTRIKEVDAFLEPMAAVKDHVAEMGRKLDVAKRAAYICNQAYQETLKLQRRMEEEA